MKLITLDTILLPQFLFLTSPLRIAYQNLCYRRYAKTISSLAGNVNILATTHHACLLVSVITIPLPLYCVYPCTGSVHAVFSPVEVFPELPVLAGPAPLPSVCGSVPAKHPHLWKNWNILFQCSCLIVCIISIHQSSMGQHQVIIFIVKYIISKPLYFVYHGNLPAIKITADYSSMLFNSSYHDIFIQCRLVFFNSCQEQNFYNSIYPDR